MLYIPIVVVYIPSSLKDDAPFFGCRATLCTIGLIQEINKLFLRDAAPELTRLEHANEDELDLVAQLWVDECDTIY